MGHDRIKSYVDDASQAWVEIAEIYDGLSTLAELAKSDKWGHDLTRAQLNQANKKFTSACVMMGMAAYQQEALAILDRISEGINKELKLDIPGTQAELEVALGMTVAIRETIAKHDIQEIYQSMKPSARVMK